MIKKICAVLFAGVLVLPSYAIDQENNTKTVFKINPQKRKQIRRACDECRRKHQRCDNDLPCGRCISRGDSHLCQRSARRKEPPAEKHWSTIYGNLNATSSVTPIPIKPLAEDPILLTNIDLRTQSEKNLADKKPRCDHQRVWHYYDCKYFENRERVMYWRHEETESEENSQPSSEDHDVESLTSEDYVDDSEVYWSVSLGNNIDEGNNQNHWDGDFGSDLYDGDFFHNFVPDFLLDLPYKFSDYVLYPDK